jgi:hypothetical protein
MYHSLVSKSQLPHKTVNLIFKLVIVNNKLANLDVRRGASREALGAEEPGVLPVPRVDRCSSQLNSYYWTPPVQWFPGGLVFKAHRRRESRLKMLIDGVRAVYLMKRKKRRTLTFDAARRERRLMVRSLVCCPCHASNVCCAATCFED